MPRKNFHDHFLICIDNASYPASLEVRKVYAALPGSEADPAGFVRVIDESGEDYLYPQSIFIAVSLPPGGGRRRVVDGDVKTRPVVLQGRLLPAA